MRRTWSANWLHNSHLASASGLHWVVSKCPMTIPLSETPTVGLGQYIRETRFTVPHHQRDYSWKEEYVSTFLDDIEAAMAAGDELYFCGLMVLVKSSAPSFQVLDGQQRLATTLMILGAIRNWLGGYSAYHKAQTQIEERYLGESDLGEEQVKPKLVLNAANNDVFSRFVIKAVPLSDIEKALSVCKKADRNRALLEAAVYINKRIIDKGKSFDDPEKAKSYFLHLVTYMNDTVQIVRLVVSGDEAAYTIFETLNDRGMELSPLDLVKNHLFSRAERKGDQSLRDLEGRWTEMMTLLSTVKADSFLRAFWASRRGALEGSKLFKQFKKEYTDPSAAYNVSLDMRSAAERYVALTDQEDPVWAPYGEKARDSVNALSIIGASQLHPVLLAALDKFDNHEMTRLLRLLEVIAVRYQLVSRGRPGRIESLGARLAKAITDGAVKTASVALTELRELYIPDDQFRSEFTSKTERESKKAAYLLRGLEHQALVRANDPHQNETRPHLVTIEHILPKSPGKGWPDTLRKETDLHNDLLFRLGNLCLLDNNNSVGNKEFDEKKKQYGNSKLLTTKSVADYATWDENSISHRQQLLAGYAVSEWRFQ